MRNVLSWVWVGLLATACMGAGSRQKTPNNKLSPPADADMKLGGHEIEIEYNAPSARGRKVEGGLIPYGDVWRTGADAATTLTADADVMIGGSLRVPKGVYTVYTLASEGAWQLIINKQTGQWGTEYDQGKDLGRVPLKLTKLSAPVEKFEIKLEPAGANTGALSLRWGTTEASVSVSLAQ
jgi:hypothetical protein